MSNSKTTSIGFFDSGFGGLTILKEAIKRLPEYDYVYLGDNARAPYGSRSFESVYAYTLECVKKLFDLNCELVILACNTASAKALRSIQQNDLPYISLQKRVLGVIRPTTEIISNFTKTNTVGVLATTGTVSSLSYLIEIKKFAPQVEVFQQACPMLVPLIENNELDNPGASYFIEKYTNELMKQNKDIDTILLACTHYPLIYDKIKKVLPPRINLIAQGELVANSLENYLKRHADLNQQLTKQSTRRFYTTDSALQFNQRALLFFGSEIWAEQIKL